MKIKLKLRSVKTESEKKTKINIKAENVFSFDLIKKKKNTRLVKNCQYYNNTS